MEILLHIDYTLIIYFIISKYISTLEKLFLFKINYIKKNLNIFNMINKIQNIYIKICLSILKVVDPHKKPIGRPNKYDYIFYIKHIINITVNGLSWKLKIKDF